MSAEGEFDTFFEKLFGDVEEDIPIDVDLKAVRELQEQVSMAAHFQQMRLSNSCPNCGSEMGERKRVILRAGDFFSDVCDVGCAVALFRRKFPNPKNLVSRIEVIHAGTRKPW